MALAFAKVGFDVTGIDIDLRKVGQLSNGLSYSAEVSSADVRAMGQASRFRATADFSALADRDTILLCVPITLDAARIPNRQALERAIESIQTQLKPGQMVVSCSDGIGETQDLIRVCLERSGLSATVDFDLIYMSPRIDPGRLDFTIANTPLVIGGVTQRAIERGMRLVNGLGVSVHPISSPSSAEMSKLLEGAFRAVNIALVNELAPLCERMGLDIWEIINAATGKPFGFMPFSPGAGVGGQFIPVQTELLAAKAREHNLHLPLIETAVHINLSMASHAVHLLEHALSQVHVALRGAKVIVVGVAYKRDTEDIHDAPARRIIEMLIKQGAQVSYHDPYVPRLEIGGTATLAKKRSLVSVALDESTLELTHGVIIVTGHHAVDYANLVRHARAVVDCVNATEGVKTKGATIIRLGVGGK